MFGRRPERTRARPTPTLFWSSRCTRRKGRGRKSSARSETSSPGPKKRGSRWPESWRPSGPGKNRFSTNRPQRPKRRVRKAQEKKAANRKRGQEDRHRNKANDLLAVHTDEVTTEQHREAGSVHVGYPFWKRLGLDDILTDVGLTARARALTCVMTINRLVYPSSELAMPDWIRSTALDDLMGVDFTARPTGRNQVCHCCASSGIRRCEGRAQGGTAHRAVAHP